MTREELTAEKDSMKSIQKVPCICGSDKLCVVCNLYTGYSRLLPEYYIKCKRCDLEGPHIDRLLWMSEDDCIYEAKLAWDWQIEELIKERKHDT